MKSLIVFPAGASGHFLAGILTGNTNKLDNQIEYKYAGNRNILDVAHVSQLTTGATQDKDYSIKRFKEIAHKYQNTNVVIIHPDIDWYIYILWMLKTDDEFEDTIEQVADSRYVNDENTNEHYKHHHTFSAILKQQKVNVLDINYSGLFITVNKETIKQLLSFLNIEDQVNTIAEKINQYTEIQLETINSRYKLDREDI